MADEEKEEKEGNIDDKEIGLNEEVLGAIKILAELSEEDRVFLLDVLDISEGVIEYLSDHPKGISKWKKIVVLDTTKKILEAGKE